VVAHVVSLLDANAAGLMRINPNTERLEMKSLFSLESHPNPELRILSIPLKSDENLHPALSMLAEIATQADKSLIYNDEPNASLFGCKNLIAVPMRGREEMMEEAQSGGPPMDTMDEDEDAQSGAFGADPEEAGAPGGK